MTTLPAWARRLLRKELRLVAEGMEFDREAAAKLLALLAPRRKNEKQKATQKRKLQGAQAARARSAEIRAAVMKRAHNSCEAARYRPYPTYHSFVVEWDHWRGGKDRKRLESVETTWALCVTCHKDRQQNRASVGFWNDVFRFHCDSHGYPFTPHVEHAQLPGRAAR